MARLLWITAVLMAAVGVTLAAVRTAKPAGYIPLMEPLYQRVMQAAGNPEALTPERKAINRAVDAKFSRHRWMTLLHVVPGGLYLLLAPLQLSKRVRKRLAYHRWQGRLLIVLGLTSIPPAFYFGLLMPLGGIAESVAIVLAGGLFGVALVRAWVAIRGRDIDLHREWMLRAFGAAIAISVDRLVAGAFDVALSPAGWSVPAIFVLALWTSWILTIGAMELWIHYTRLRPAVRLST